MKLYHYVFLCMAFCLCCGTAAASWSSHCCLKTSNRRIPVNMFVDYTVQTAGLCPINAIVFRTKKCRQLCYSLELDWAKQAMKNVDQRKENKGASCNPATSLKPRKSRKGKRKGKKQKGKQKKQ